MYRCAPWLSRPLVGFPARSEGNGAFGRTVHGAVGRIAYLHGAWISGSELGGSVAECMHVIFPIYILGVVLQAECRGPYISSIQIWKSRHADNERWTLSLGLATVRWPTGNPKRTQALASIQAPGGVYAPCGTQEKHRHFGIRGTWTLCSAGCAHEPHKALPLPHTTGRAALHFEMLPSPRPQVPRRDMEVLPGANDNPSVKPATTCLALHVHAQMPTQNLSNVVASSSRRVRRDSRDVSAVAVDQ